MERQKNTSNNAVWGYLVCFGTVITFIAGIGHVNSFGLIYKDFMINTNSTAKSLTTAHGVFSIMLAIGGIILNQIIRTHSLRLGGIIGSIIFITGSALTILISNINQLPLTFGVLQGIGFGMMVPVCYSTMNHYYVKKRTTVMSMCKATQGIVLIWYPLLLKKILSFYGFRGALLVISGIGIHTIPGMLVMRTDKRRILRSIKAANETENIGNSQENLDLMVIEGNHRGILDPRENDDIASKYSKRDSHCLLDILNIQQLSDPIFWNICVGQSFINFSDLTFFILQPLLLFQYGYNEVQVVTCISICAGADVAGRCALAIMSSVFVVNTRVLFYIATVFTFLIRIVVLQIRQFLWMAVATGCLGVLRAWLHIASPLVISSHVSHKDFPGAYAIFMLSAGVVNVTLSPLVGLLRDLFGDYIPTFYALTFCCIPCLVFWPLEYWHIHLGNK